MTMSSRVLAACVLLMLAAPAAADRYVCQWGDLPATYVPDAVEMSISLDASRGGLIPPTLLNPFNFPPVPVVTQPVQATVNADPNPAASRIVVATAASGPTDLGSDSSELATPETGDPNADAAFMTELRAVYGDAQEPELSAIFHRYQQETAAGLALRQKVGNAVVKFIVETNTTPTLDSTAKPDLLKPAATRGTVRSANGVGVRQEPWGATAGNSLGQGATVELVPPASGPWYKLSTGGWVAGLWLDLQ